MSAVRHLRRWQHDPKIKPYRSQAERTRVLQGYLLIAIAAGSWLTNLLVVLKVFHIIHP